MSIPDYNGYISNVAVDHRLVGLEVLMSPFAANTSSQRLAMLASHLPQAMVLHGGEYPKIASGYENQIGSYEYQGVKTDEEIQILATIPKYIVNQGISPIRENPMMTVVYRGNESGVISYFDIHTYTSCMDGFGYKNQILNSHYLHDGNCVPRDTVFSTSPAHKGDQYALGVNAKAVFLSLDGVTKDAFIISQSLADKMKSTAIKTMEIRISPNQIPLNIYGDGFEYKFFPDIGEVVREDGMLLCTRNVTAQTFLSDMAENSIGIPQFLTDKCYMAPYSNTSIIDIDVVVNNNGMNKDLTNVYGQVLKYRDGINRYYTRIAEVYNTIKHRGEIISPTFNNLVTTAFARLLADGIRVPGFGKKAAIRLVKKKEQINFILIKIKYMYENVVVPGYKVTSRQGGKGVIGEIWEDDRMPQDEYGIRADIILAPESVPNRMNPSVLYETFLTRSDELERRRIAAIIEQGIVPTDTCITVTPDWVGAWNHFYTYMCTVNPNYAEVFDTVCDTDDKKQRMLRNVIDHGIYHTVLPYNEYVGCEWVQDLSEKFPSPSTPVSFYIDDAYGLRKLITTVDPVHIGEIYLYGLCKIPHLKSPGVAYVNQYYTPIQTNKEQKQLYPISQTPLRAGEDEVRNLGMSCGFAQARRLLALYANSPEGVTTMCRALLTSDRPTAIGRVNLTTPYLERTNNMVAMAQHMLATVGVATNVPVKNPMGVMHDVSVQ